MTAVEKWFSEIQDIWLSKQPERLSEMLAEPLFYFETPFNAPLTTISDVINEWQTIKDQIIEVLEITPLYQTNDVGIAQWRFKRMGASLHIGAYYIRLNAEGKCVEFRQWWNTPNA